MRVLVTGGNGFLGSHVCEELLHLGHDLRLLLRPTSSTDYIDEIEGMYERADGDVRSAETLRKACAGIDTVVHVAGLTSALSEREFRAVNAEGTRAAVEAAVGAGVKRFVYVSSLAASTQDDGAVADGQPISAYGRSKLAGEVATLARSASISTCVVRPPAIYGPRDRAMLHFFRLIKYGVMPLFGDGSNRIAWIHAYDCATAIATAAGAEGPSASVYTIADGPAHSWRELADAVAAAQGRRPLMLQVPPLLYAAVGQVADIAASILQRPLPLSPDRVREMARPAWTATNERIAAELGWEPRIAPREGIEQTLRWYREHRWL